MVVAFCSNLIIDKNPTNQTGDSWKIKQGCKKDG